MTRRSLTILTLAAWGCGFSTLCPAQNYAPAGDVVTLPPEAGGYGGAYSSQAFGDGYSGLPPGFNGASGPPGAPCPPQYGPQDCQPRPAGWWPWKCRPLFISPKLLKPPRGAYFRAEYLLWEIEEPGNEPLGAPNDFAAQPNLTLPFIDSATGALDFAYVPRMEELQLRDNSGVRLTYGVPLKNYATIETSIWLLEQASDHYEFGGVTAQIPPEFFFPGIPLTPSLLPFPVESTPGTSYDVDGEPFIRNHEDGLEVTYKSDLWGADAQLVVDALAPQGEGLKLRPLFGFKYVGLTEGMYQRGTFQNDVTGEVIDSSITSDTNNTILGGTIGLRTELEHRWFLLGVQPAVTFAGNISQVRVASERFISPTDPRIETESDFFNFAPILDLKLYARVKVTDNLRLHVGYDAFWMANVYRAARVIDYQAVNENGTQRSDIRAQDEDDHLAVEGLSVGAEFVF